MPDLLVARSPRYIAALAGSHGEREATDRGNAPESRRFRAIHRFRATADVLHTLRLGSLPMRTLRPLAAAVVAACALGVGSIRVGAQGALPLRLTAFAVNMSNVGPGSSGTLDIVIERWSTEPERQTLMTSFIEKGESALLSALQKAPAIGYFKVPERVGYDLHFARQTDLPEGGHRIVVATDRPVGFWEARNQPRTMDYPFTLVEMRLNKNYEGEGKLSVATKIIHNKKDNVIELENYASEPVRLNNVKLLK